MQIGIFLNNGNPVTNSPSTSVPDENTVRAASLKAKISSAEAELKRLESSRSAEKSELTSELNRCKNELDRIENKKEQPSETEQDVKRRFDSFECQTCKNRRYKDESNDSGVSFQSATKVAPAAADSAVRSHENEHVARNRTKAEQNGMKIVSQTVTIHRAICPECGKVYTCGGVTKTVTKADDSISSKYSVGMQGSEKAHGSGLDVVA